MQGYGGDPQLFKIKIQQPRSELELQQAYRYDEAIMKKIILLLLISVILLTGCQTTPDYEDKTDDAALMLTARLPEIDIKDQELATCIIELLNHVNGKSNALIIKKVVTIQDKSREPALLARLRQRHSRLYTACDKKRIKLRISNATLADLLDLTTSSAGIKWIYKNEQVIVTAPDGTLLMH
ncbi:hypothetical protein BVX94_00905 [bacterium B17]|nr:hypothetical protein BVX94_00905 [bacterium B17]